jgi:hypothetical protein
MCTPTRFTYGIATVAKGKPLSSYPLPDPFNSTSDTGFGVSTYSNDFHTVNTEDFAISGTSSTFAVTTGLGGLALVTPGAATTATALFKTGTSIGFVAGQKLWYTARLEVSATTGTFLAGLASAGTSATDGLWFVTSGTSVNLVSRVGSTSTTLITGVATVAASTFIQLSFHYDNTDLVVFVNGNLVARVTSPTIGSSGTTLTSALLSPIFSDTPTATETMTIDYVLAAVEVSR